MATPPIDPQSILTGLFTPQQPQAQQPMPQGLGGDATSQAIQALTQQLQGLPTTAQATGQLSDIQNRISGMQPVQAPQLWQPRMQPVTGAKSLLGDIGNALLMGTGFGRNIVGGVNELRQKNFENQRQAQLEQLAQLKQQQEIPETELGASSKIAEGLGGLGTKQAMLGIRQQQADIQQQRVNDIRTFRTGLLALDTSKLSEQQRHNKQDELLQGMGIQVQRDRNNVLLTLGDKRIAIDATKFDAAQNNKEQGLFDQIGVALGLKQFEGTGAPTAPINTAAPAMQTAPPAGPTARGTKPAAKSNKPTGGVIKWGRDAQGNPVRLQ